VDARDRFSLINTDFETGGQIRMINAPVVVRNKNPLGPNCENIVWNTYSNTYAAGEICGFLQLYRTLIVGHGCYAVYMFCLDVRNKERELPNRPFEAGQLADRSEQVVGIGSVL